MNVISSRTPDGWPNECQICGHAITISPSIETLDATCPHCGSLLWFAEFIPPARRWRTLLSGDGSKLPLEVTIERGVVNLIPESLARQIPLLPLESLSDGILVAAPELDLEETIQRLTFILNRRILAIPADSAWIAQQVNRHYGPPP